MVKTILGGVEFTDKQEKEARMKLIRYEDINVNMFSLK